MLHIEIDSSSGFCFGVTAAIQKAEAELERTGKLYCLGDIVHNEREVGRLSRHGLRSIDHPTYNQLHDATVLLRAHGEPPQTYTTAKRNHLQLIDATCPVVLKLQQRIRQQFLETSTHPDRKTQIAIFGKQGHAEVLGLVAQTEGQAIVIETVEDLEKLDFSQSVILYSQTTRPLEEYRQIASYIEQNIIPPAKFRWFDTICRQVSSRALQIESFARKWDAVLFVSGRQSSNGKALFSVCRRANRRSYLVEGPEEINPEWFSQIETLGISGATSTPTWLMEECRRFILERQS